MLQRLDEEFKLPDAARTAVLIYLQLMQINNPALVERRVYRRGQAELKRARPSSRPPS